MASDTLTHIGAYVLNPAMQATCIPLPAPIGSRFSRFKTTDRTPHLPKGCTEFWVSSAYVVQVFGENMLGLRRNNAQDFRESWSEIQRIKEEIWPGVWCVEHFPPPDATVNVAPMRWLWRVSDPSDLPQFHSSPRSQP